MFTLGSPAGWRTNKGLYIGRPDRATSTSTSRRTGTTRCIGFDAITARTGNVVTAFYSAAGVIYGFAIVIAVDDGLPVGSALRPA